MATQISTTVQNVLQIIADLRGEPTVNSDASRIRAISNANRDFALRKFWNFYLLPDQTVSGSGATSYSIGSTTYPMRYKGLCEVFVGGTTEDKRFQVVDYNRFKNLYNRDNSTRLVYEWYDVVNDAWKVRINPTPTASDTITYTYYWMPPTLTLTTERVVCPNPKIIALLALGEIYDGEEEPEASATSKNEAEQMITEVMGVENAPAVNQTYEMTAVENMSKPQGIGSY